MIEFAPLAIALAVGVLVGILVSVIGQKQESKTKPEDLRPREPKPIEPLALEIEKLRREVETKLISIRQTPIAIEVPDFVVDELTRKLMFACVVACRAERVKMSDHEIEKYRMGWWVRANRLAEIAKRNPVDDIRRPDQSA